MYEAEKAYYRAPQVRSRIIEYCGGSGGEPEGSTAQYLVTDGNITTGLGIPEKSNAITPSELDRVLSRGVDIFRSMWDRDSMVAILDVDYQNADFPYDALHNPSDVFEKMEPAFTVLRQVLADRGIGHNAVMTGQGYHFVWSIPDGYPSGGRLFELGQVLPSLRGKYMYDHPYTGDTVPLKKAAMNAGLALVLEYLAHLVLAGIRDAGGIPAVATGLPVGARPNGRGRESVSLDLSSYGDPLYMRYFRCAFSVYHKPIDPGLYRVCLPRNSSPLKDLLAIRSNLEAAARYAQNVTARIAEAGNGTQRLIDEYLKSDLRSFHQYFHSGYHDEPQTWLQGYDRLNPGELPPCVAVPLMSPNPLLPAPGNLQNVTRVLVSRGWHPRSVAGLIRSRFERDFNWGVGWLYYDAATRADFYVRLYSGLVATGIDYLVDFNCISHQEKGLCPRPWCGFNLADYKEPLWKALGR